MGEVIRGIFADHLAKSFNDHPLSEAPKFKVDDEVKIHVKDLDMLTGIGQVISLYEDDEQVMHYLVRFVVKTDGDYEEEDWFFFANELELYTDDSSF